MSNHEGSHHHFILPVKTGTFIWITLMVLTVITVWIAQFNFGALNFAIAMLVATIKASLVAMFFMGLKYDKLENRVIFIASLIFFAIFMVLTFSDLAFRGAFRVQQPFFAESGSQPKFANPWKVTPELLAHGKAVFETNCVTCHGAQGKGDGPAGSAFNPRPRNFTEEPGWKNGRKPTQIFATLKNGLGSMPSFASLPLDDRWGVVHYVASLGPNTTVVTDADLKSVGVDPSGAVSAAAKTLPIDFAIERMATGN